MLPRNSLLLAALACAPFSLLAETAPASATAPAKPAAVCAVGQPAPAYKPSAWIQGEPVATLEKGKVYLFECWATWCGPCVAQIPHLNGFHKKYADKGLVVIGTHVFNRKETPETVAAFVKKQGDKMGYRVAYDDRTTGEFTRDWLVPAKVNGIPHAFVVRDGTVIWEGHPGELSDDVVESMLAGKFDSEKAQKKRAAQDSARSALGAASKKVSTLIAAKDFDGAMKAVDEFEALLPATNKSAGEMARARVLVAKGDKAGAVARLAKLAEASPADTLVQYNVAMTLSGGAYRGDKAAVTLGRTCLARLVKAKPELASDAAVKHVTEALDKSSGETASEAKPAGNA